jgi:hypothetical protein
LITKQLQTHAPTSFILSLSHLAHKELFQLRRKMKERCLRGGAEESCFFHSAFPSPIKDNNKTSAANIIQKEEKKTRYATGASQPRSRLHNQTNEFTKM